MSISPISEALDALPLDDGDARDWQLEHLVERLADLELAREDSGWLRLGIEGTDDFTRQGLGLIAETCRLYAAKNPLIKRAVALQTFYIWAQGVSFVAKDPRVQDVVDDFLDDRKNQVELTSHQARTGKERDLAVSGNLFFAFFVNQSTGRVRVRSIPFAEVQDIYFNPEDRREPWYYLRQWSTSHLQPGSPTPIVVQRKAWFPDWRHTRAKVPELGGIEVIDTPIYHVKVDGFDGMKFGVPEVYAAIDWARAYKEFLTDWATLVKALSRFAWKQTVRGGVAARTAAVAKLGRQPASALEVQTNRATPGGTWVQSEGSDLAPIPKTGATTSADDGRRLLLMVAAATGNPETFFGDVSVGTLATATSLDRPTELRFRDRQSLWSDVLRDILDWVIDRAIEAPNGPLDGQFVPEEAGEEGEGEWILAPGEPKPGAEPEEEGNRSVEVKFPPILEHDFAGSVTAAVQAITLGGSPISSDLLTPRQAGEILLAALNIDNAEEWLDEAFPVDKDGNPVDRPDQAARKAMALDIAKATAPVVAPGQPPAPPQGGQDNNPPSPAQEALQPFREAIRELITAVEAIKGE